METRSCSVGFGAKTLSSNEKMEQVKIDARGTIGMGRQCGGREVGMTCCYGLRDKDKVKVGDQVKAAAGGDGNGGWKARAWRDNWRREGKKKKKPSPREVRELAGWLKGLHPGTLAWMG